MCAVFTMSTAINCKRKEHLARSAYLIWLKRARLVVVGRFAEYVHRPHEETKSGWHCEETRKSHDISTNIPQSGLQKPSPARPYPIQSFCAQQRQASFSSTVDPLPICRQ